ncbi:hypothetical protein U1Q18_052641 [Sarracenia purpurea var. burkii]
MTSQVAESEFVAHNQNAPLLQVVKPSYKEVLQSKVKEQITGYAEDTLPIVAEDDEDSVAEDVESVWLKDFNVHQKGISVVGAQKENYVGHKPNPKRMMKVTKERKSKTRVYEKKHISKQSCTISQESITSSDIRNRNSILWKEAQGTVEVGKQLGIDYGENEEFFVERIMEMNIKERQADQAL